MSTITASDRMTNRRFHAARRARRPHHWWVKVDGEFLDIPKVRGDDDLEIEVDIPAGTVCEVGCGCLQYGIRETVVSR